MATRSDKYPPSCYRVVPNALYHQVLAKFTYYPSCISHSALCAGSGSEVDKSDQGDGEEETETEEDGLSGEAPILQMSAGEFMRHLTNE